MISLTLKEQPTVPLEAEAISPDVLANLNHDEIRAIPVLLGKRTRRLADFFDVEGERSDDVVLRGDATKVKWIGRGMSRGRVRIVGNVGMHLGAYMTGGAIEVDGNTGDWVGGEMSGGTIHVRGNVGGQVAAAYRGSITGMNGGTILVEGTAGIELGMRMKRGLIAIRGAVRDFAGLQMKGGTIVLMSGAELRTGAWMSRGTIISMKPLRLLPTFSFCAHTTPTFLHLYSRHLASCGFDIPFRSVEGSYHRHAGDSSVPGKGEILVWQPTA
jgi:formylmethanofuran dehydrogenase subunit C